MKILLYNYLQPEDGGGGVGIYSTNLAKALKSAGHHVITLSSGDVYAFTSRRPCLRTWHKEFDRALIVNSPMIAPASDAWDDFGTYTTDLTLEPMPELLRRKYGLIDVFHFQNLEGLTAAFFRQLRREFPAARLIYSVHNYGNVCAQAHLWFQNSTLCTNYRDGLNCTRCFPLRDSSQDVRSYRRRRPVVHAVNRYAPKLAETKRSLMRLIRPKPFEGKAAASIENPEGPSRQPNSDDLDRGGQPRRYPGTDGDGTPYRQFRQTNIALLAETFDHVLAVSKRTQDVLVASGVKPGNVATSYIGTGHKAAFNRATKIMDIGPQLHIAYLGYMHRQKGFHMLLQALELLPEQAARKIAVTIAAKRVDNPAAYERLLKIAPRLGAFHYHDGFTHGSLDAVLTGVNLGVVPPVWEDNLPQVAIEMVSRGIPVLTSDRGGAQEIADNPHFIYEAESAAALQERFQLFSSREIPLSCFWDRPMRIFSMEEHVDELVGYYAPAHA